MVRQSRGLLPILNSSIFIQNVLYYILPYVTYKFRNDELF